MNPIVGRLFGPTILFWMDLFDKGALAEYNPTRLANLISMPVMIIHGEKDSRFPLAFARRLKQSFTHDRVAFYVAPGAGHSESSQTPGYGDAVKSFIDQYLSE